MCAETVIEAKTPTGLEIAGYTFVSLCVLIILIFLVLVVIRYRRKPRYAYTVYLLIFRLSYLSAVASEKDLAADKRNKNVIGMSY